MKSLSGIPIPASLTRKLPVSRIVAYIISALVILLILDMSRMPQEQVSAKILLFSIRQYQRFISPNIGRVVVCKFEPTCSRYGYTSIEWYGSFWGSIKTFQRLWRCSPWDHRHGWDPPG